MDIEQFKQNVRESFVSVDSLEFLELQIKRGVEKHRNNFREYLANKPYSNFEIWKDRLEKSVNQNPTNNEETMAIGIFLLALDEFEKEIT